MTAPLGSALRISVMRLSRRMRQERTEGLSASQVAALATMERQGPLSLGELAALERVQPPSMTRVVTGLVDAGQHGPEQAVQTVRPRLEEHRGAVGQA